MKKVLGIFTKTVTSLKTHHVSDMAAALSFYALFAFIPVILIMLSVARLIVTDLTNQSTIIGEASLLFGPQVGIMVQGVIKRLLTNANIDTWAYWAGIGGLCLGASSIFIQLQRSFHILWGIDTYPNTSISSRIQNRLISFILLCGSSILLLFILVSNLLLSIFTISLVKLTSAPTIFTSISDTFVLGLTVMLLFALLFRFVPLKKIHWSDILVGAGVTTILYMLGRYVLSLYFHFATIGTLFGAAGSLIVFLLWLYYTALIFFFGAQFTYIYAREAGAGISWLKK